MKVVLSLTLGLPLILRTRSVHKQRRGCLIGQQRGSFTPEFKPESVDLCRRSEKSECEVAWCGIRYGAAFALGG